MPCLGSEDLRAGADNDPVRLRIAAVAGIAGGIENIRAPRIVQDRRAAVVAAVGVGFCEAEFSLLIDLGDRAEIILADRIGRIDVPGTYWNWIRRARRSARRSP